MAKHDVLSVFKLPRSHAARKFKPGKMVNEFSTLNVSLNFFHPLLYPRGGDYSDSKAQFVCMRGLVVVPYLGTFFSWNRIFYPKLHKANNGHVGYRSPNGAPRILDIDTKLNFKLFLDRRPAKHDGKLSNYRQSQTKTKTLNDLSRGIHTWRNKTSSDYGAWNVSYTTQMMN